jgi:hypothetical protein
MRRIAKIMRSEAASDGGIQQAPPLLSAARRLENAADNEISKNGDTDNRMSGSCNTSSEVPKK